MTAEALEVTGARAESAVQVERRDRAARPLPRVAAASGDEHDGPVEPLDEPRRHDADHAFVPVLAPDDVAARSGAAPRPRLDRASRLAQDAVLDRLPLAIQLREPLGQRGRLGGVLGEDQLERDIGTPQPPGRIDPWREPEPDLARVDGGGIDSGRPHQRLQPGPSRAAQAPAARRSRATGSRPREARRRRSWRARPGRDGASAPDARRRAAPARASARRPCRRAPGTDTPTAALRRRGSRAASRRAGGDP